ncbi:hypothetical protein LTR27_004470 [Elasticomyces elasticus]|nr:hypothetical protein LTR27_004470 [Elasticomyces elasticus]
MPEQSQHASRQALMGLALLRGPIAWSGLAPQTQDGGICCLGAEVASPIPQNHGPFPSPTGATDSKDPQGWLYMLKETHIGYTGAQELSSLLAPATINSVLNYCAVSYPSGVAASCTSSLVDAAVNAVGIAGQLVTTTIHITASSSATVATAASNAVPAKVSISSSPQTSTVEVDPVTAAVSNGGTEKTSSSPARDSAAPQSSAQQDQQSYASQTAQPSSSAISTIPTTVYSSLPGTGAEPASGTGPASTAVAVLSAPSSAASSYDVGGMVVALLSVYISITSTRQSSSIGDTAALLSPAVSESSTLSPGSTDNTLATTDYDFIESNTVVVGPARASTAVSGDTGITGSSNDPVIVTVSADNVDAAITSSISMQSAYDTNGVLQPLTLGSAVLIPISASKYVIGTQTLIPGGSTITVSGTPYSLASSPSELIFGSSTTKLAGYAATPSLPPIPIGSSTVTAVGNSEYVLGSRTLVPGGPGVNIAGTLYSLDPGATELVAGTVTESLMGASGIGSYIWAAIGGSPSATNATLTSALSSSSLGPSGVVRTGTGAASTPQTQLSGAAIHARITDLALPFGIFATVLVLLGNFDMAA